MTWPQSRDVGGQVLAGNAAPLAASVAEGSTIAGYSLVVRYDIGVRWRTCKDREALTGLLTTRAAKALAAEVNCMFVTWTRV
jgi:hypothetical protein